MERSAPDTAVSKPLLKQVADSIRIHYLCEIIVKKDYITPVEC
ncbi:hypothetical protein ACFOGG_00350 [Brenneria rubrifaciens]